MLILTTFDLDEYVYEALRAGASGFLLKDTPPEQLVDAIRLVVTGDALLSPEITWRIVAEFARRADGGERPPEIEELEPDELELLARVARGLSNAEIAEEDVEEASASTTSPGSSRSSGSATASTRSSSRTSRACRAQGAAAHDWPIPL